MYKKIFLLDNFDSFTFNLVDYLKQLGCEVHVYRNDVDVEKVEEINPDLIVFSPGPSVPKNAGNMMKIIDKYHKKYPMFGVCLGHEAFIEYFGGSLKFVTPVHGRSSAIEHDGKTIFKGIAQNFSGGRYHSLAAAKVPNCFEISAMHEDIVMAIRHKKLPIEGVQFHPESVLTMKNGVGLQIIKNALGETNVTEFLKQSIAGKLNVEEQERFLMSHEKVTANELCEAVKFLQLQISEKIKLDGAIDVCGTGGSKLQRINTSTISAFIIAALGVKVAKHGNKAASGRFGSFDLLEAIGINIDQNAKDIESLFKNQNLTFLFARKFYPVMANFAESRAKIGKPTFFNLLGPLLSPAKVERQIIGTTFKDKMGMIAETCRLLGSEHVYVVCGEDGLDEVSLTGKTYVCELKSGKIKNYTIAPEDFGLKECSFKQIASKDREENIKIALDILEGKCKSRHLDLVLINSALALKMMGRARTLKAGYLMAKKAVNEGLAYEKFVNVKTLSHSPSILLEIAENKILEVADRKKKLAQKGLIKLVKPSDRNFKEALIGERIALIAEIKKRSPSQGNLSKEKLSVRDLAKTYEMAGASCISVLCEKKYFGGDLKDLHTARAATFFTPLLCKDFIIDEYQIYEARKYGADAILLIAALLNEKQINDFLKVARKLKMAAICEVHNVEELKKALKTSADIIGINNRDLHTFEIDLNTSGKLIPLIPKDKLIVVESGINERKDVVGLPANHAILVGSSIMQSKNKVKKIHELIGKKSQLKICGIRKLDDAEFCEKLGVDFIGLNFVPSSKRKINVVVARKIGEKLKRIKKVGIFQNQDIDEVNKLAVKCGLDFIQLSGDESVAYVKKCLKPVIKAINVSSKADVKKAGKYEKYCAQILFDGSNPGSGKIFNHDFLKKHKEPFFVAGGIRIDNLEKILEQSNVNGVDIASGIETDGKVDQKKIKQFLNKLI